MYVYLSLFLVDTAHQCPYCDQFQVFLSVSILRWLVQSLNKQYSELVLDHCLVHNGHSTELLHLYAMTVYTNQYHNEHAHCMYMYMYSSWEVGTMYIHVVLLYHGLLHVGHCYVHINVYAHNIKRIIYIVHALWHKYTNRHTCIWQMSVYMKWCMCSSGCRHTRMTDIHIHVHVHCTYMYMYVHISCK